MARVKLYEQSAKRIVYNKLSIPYSGVSVTDNIPKLAKGKYVVKVDSGIKKRFKNNLIYINIDSSKIKSVILKMKELGHNHFIIEKFIPHQEEIYLSLIRKRKGIVLQFSLLGGVDIENQGDSIKTYLVNDNYKKIASETKLNQGFLKSLVEIFNAEYFSFLEINPLTFKNNQPVFLDLAVEVDSAGQFFSTWTEEDLVKPNLTKEEIIVQELNRISPASLSLSVINPDGEIFLLLSGGGACLVLADEVYNLGSADRLANYGEYSGNPTEEETYLYTKQILSLAKKSKAKKKILIIAGGIANFTDIAKTFKGIIKALDEDSNVLDKVYVRRGGPNQEEGLKTMKEFLDKNKLNGGVYGRELSLNSIIELAL